MRIAIGSDHAGFGYKQTLAEELRQAGHDVHDVGTYNEEPADYPDFARAVAERVAAKQADKGVIFCGSGVGASIAANKVRGARAGNVCDAYSARQGVEHDDMNILVMGQRTLGIEVARVLLREFVEARFSGEDRHVRRLNKVLEIENSQTHE